MPLLSAFTPLGVLELGTDPPPTERMYDAIWADYGSNYARGGHQDASIYARAMGLGCLLLASQRLEAQITAQTAYDLLPARETEFGVVVPALATIAERRAALATAMLLPAGGTFSNVQQALANLLGADLAAYRPTAPLSSAGLTGAAAVVLLLDDVVSSPSNPAAQPNPVNFDLPQTVRALARLPAPPPTSALPSPPGGVSTGLGAPQAVQLTGLTGGTAPRFAVGDKLVIEPELLGRTEVVTVSAVDATGTLVTATFLNAHEPGALVARGSYPAWVSTKRHALVALSPTAARDAETRRQTHDLLGKMSRSVSTWDLAQVTGGTASGPFTGPFRVGVGKIGLDTLGEIPLP